MQQIYYKCTLKPGRLDSITTAWGSFYFVFWFGGVGGGVVGVRVIGRSSCANRRITSSLFSNALTVRYHHFPNSARHFASASRPKFSHDDVQTDNDWIFKINEISISNRKPTTDQSYSECVWCVFLQDFTKHVDSKIVPKHHWYAFLYE